MTGNPDEQTGSDKGDEGNSSPNGGEESYKKVAHGAVIVMAGTVIGLALGFLARAVPARLLGPGEYGLLVLGFTVANTLLVLVNLGLPAGVARNLPRYESLRDKRGIVYSALSLTLPAGFGLMLLLLGTAETIAIEFFDDPGLAPIIALFAPILPFLAIQNVVNSTFQGHKRAKERVLVSNVITPALRLILVTAAILAGFGLLGASAAWMIGIVITAAYAAYLLYREFPFLRGGSFTSQHRMLLAFSLPLVISGAMITILNQADNLLLGYFLESSDVGVYDAAFTVGKLVTAVQGAFAFLFLPVFSSLHADGESREMKRLYAIVTKWEVSLTLPVYLVILLFPDTLLSFLFGTEYSVGGVAMAVLATGFFAHVMAGLCSRALIALGYTRTVMWGNLGNGVLNLILNVLLIPILGVTGAAVASAISYVGFNSFFVYVLYRKTGILPFTRVLARPLVFSVVSILLVQIVAESFLRIRFWMLPIIFGLFVLVYGLMFIRFGGVEQEDVELILAIEKRAGIDLGPVKKLLGRIVK